MTSGNGIDAEPPSDCAAAASNLEPKNSATSSDGIVDGTSPDRAASPNRGPHEKRTSVKEAHPSPPFPLRPYPSPSPTVDAQQDAGSLEIPHHGFSKASYSKAFASFLTAPIIKKRKTSSRSIDSSCSPVQD